MAGRLPYRLGKKPWRTPRPVRLGGRSLLSPVPADVSANGLRVAPISRGQSLVRSTETKLLWCQQYCITGIPLIIYLQSVRPSRHPRRTASRGVAESVVLRRLGGIIREKIRTGTVQTCRVCQLDGHGGRSVVYRMSLYGVRHWANPEYAATDASFGTLLRLLTLSLRVHFHPTRKILRFMIGRPRPPARAQSRPKESTVATDPRTRTEEPDYPGS